MKRSFVPYLLLLMVACSKSPTDEADRQAPALTLATPTNSEVFNSGQNIMITGQVTDNKFIKEIHVVITNAGSGYEYLHVHIHPNTNSFNYSQSYIAQSGLFYKIEVIADDPSANSTSKSVQVFCN